LKKLVEDYTAMGVRGLEKKIGSVVRGVAKNIAMDELYNTVVSKKDVKPY